jgi:hypothetical protein
VRAPIGGRVCTRPHEPHGPRPCAPHTLLQRVRARRRPVAVVAPWPWAPLAVRAPQSFAPHGPTCPTAVCAPTLATPCAPRPTCPTRPHVHTSTHPHVCAPRPFAPHAPPRLRPRPRPPFPPHKTCAPMEAVRALPRARFLSISLSKLLFILPLGHPGLQLP